MIHTWTRPAECRFTAIWLLALCGLLAVAGCNSQKSTPGSPEATNDSNGLPAEGSEQTDSIPADEPVTLSRPELPDDVFFENPLALAANSTRIPEAATEPKQMADAPESESEAPDEPEDAAPKQVDWASLLPADLLHAEMLAIRDRFDPKLESVSSYNSSMLELPPYLSEMAALALIAGKHAENVPWRKDAKYIRDLAAAAIFSELTRGRQSYDQVKEPFDKISMLLDGKRPDELPDATEEGSFVLTADFGYLMKRLEIGQNALRINGGSEGAFTENASDLNRQTHVMAAIAAVIAADDYGYGEDPVYQGYARDLREQAVGAANAAKTGDFAAFEKATNLMMQSCNQCHADYRGL